MKVIMCLHYLISHLPTIHVSQIKCLFSFSCQIWKPKVPNCFLMNCYISLLHRTSFRNLHFKQWCYRAKRPIPSEPEEFDLNMSKHLKNCKCCPGHPLTALLCSTLLYSALLCSLSVVIVVIVVSVY